MHGCNVLWMPRSDWKKMQMSFSDHVQLEIDNLPISKVAQNATVVAIEAYLSIGGNYQVDIYRLDPNDYPKEYNKDTYYVNENMLHIPNYNEIVQKASTEDNDNLREFLSNNVCMIKKAKPENHHLTFDALPISVQRMVEINQKSV